MFSCQNNTDQRVGVVAIAEGSHNPLLMLQIVAIVGREQQVLHLVAIYVFVNSEVGCQKIVVGP